MTAAQYDTSEILIDKVSDWLKTASLRNTDLETVVRGCCERLAATGIPLKRIHISLSMLHPLYRAMGFTWRRGEGLKVEGYRHVEAGQEKNDMFIKSPYFHLLSHGLEHMRRRIDADAQPEFPIFEDLKKEGITDYLAFVSGFDEEWTQGILGSWSTDRPGGFNESDIAALLSIQSRLAVATRVAVLSQLAGNMLTTYLGTGAGKRVLSGQIQRGDGETIRAALIMADMRLDRDRRAGGPADLHRHAQPVLRCDRHSFQRRRSGDTELSRRRLPGSHSLRPPPRTLRDRLPAGTHRRP